MKRQKVELTITVDLTDNALDKEDKEWYEKYVLIARDDLMLYANDTEDPLGSVVKVENVRWVNEG